LDDVPSVYADARVCVGIDHSVGAFQFSNRLPIALAIGIPLVHSSFHGAPEVLSGLGANQFFRDAEGAIKAIDLLSETGSEQLDRLSETQRAVAGTMSCDSVMAYMARSALAIAQGGDPRRVANPWVRNASIRL
jgi:hypothetical protein